MRILSARKVARYLLLNQHKAGAKERVNNLKLQKLCYYAQGFALVKLGRPLFSEDIEHWPHGPVVPSLWRQYNKYGKEPIPVPDRPWADGPIYEDVVELLDEVILNYGIFSAWELRNMTHSEPPWSDTPESCPITHQKMRHYFSSLIDELSPQDQGTEGVRGKEPLSDRMAKDDRFRELTERGLADLSAGRYTPWEEVRKSLADL